MFLKCNDCVYFLYNVFGKAEGLVTVIVYVIKSYPCADLDRPRALQKVEAPRIFSQSAHEGDKIVSTTHRPPLPPKKDTWNSLLLESCVDPRAIAAAKIK